LQTRNHPQIQEVSESSLKVAEIIDFSRFAKGHRKDVETGRWDGIGFNVHSDLLWPVSMLESLGSEEIDGFNAWLDNQKIVQPRPLEGDNCILAMVVHTGDEIMVFHGTALYMGETDDHYILKILSGTHSYSKRSNIVFDSEESLNKFLTLLTLKYNNSDVAIKSEKMPVMESRYFTYAE